MIKYFGRLLLLLLLFSGITACSPKQKMIRQVKKEQRFVTKMERKEQKWKIRSYKKEQRAWFKQQPPEIQKRLKEQQRETKKFYKPYGKPSKKCASDTPPMPRSKYRKHGIK